MTGGTGLLGNALGRRLARGHQLIILSREGKAARSRITYPCEVVGWDAKSELSGRVLEGVEGVIHLAGDNIAKGRWTADRKQTLRDSRVQPLQRLQHALQANGRQLKVLVSASGVGFYGDRGNEDLTETSPIGRGFLPDLCAEWEKAAKDCNARRTVIMRLGVVFSSEGGFISEVLRMFRRFGAARLSSGQQYLSWIHADDIVEIVAQALLNPSIHGAINAVAPTPVTNAEFTKKLAVLTKSYRVPPAPAFVLRLMYGEMADLLLSSQKVKPEMLLKMKWNFKFNDIDKALSAALAAPLSK